MGIPAGRRAEREDSRKGAAARQLSVASTTVVAVRAETKAAKAAVVGTTTSTEIEQHYHFIGCRGTESDFARVRPIRRLVRSRPISFL